MTSWMICMTIKNPQQPNNLYMKSYNYLKPILLGLLYLGIGNICLADYATNMKERLSSLVEAKDQGLWEKALMVLSMCVKVILKK